MKRLIPAILCVSIVACVPTKPLTPQQELARKNERYCDTQAQAARDGFIAQQNQSRQPGGGFYGGMMQGAAQSTAYDAAFERCMMELQKQQ